MIKWLLAVAQWPPQLWVFHVQHDVSFVASSFNNSFFFAHQASVWGGQADVNRDVASAF